MDICTLVVATTWLAVVCPSHKECTEANGKLYCHEAGEYCPQPQTHYECKRPDGSIYNEPYMQSGSSIAIPSR